MLTRRNVVAGIALLPLVARARRSAWACPDRAAGWLVDRGEPGVPLLLEGQLVDAAGRPLPGFRLELYHTDARGLYSEPVDDPRRARLRGTFTTDAGGRYRVRTIVPAPYPQGGVPAHIHVHLSGPDVPAHVIDSWFFAGDANLGRAEVERNRPLGRFANVVTLQQEPKGLRVARRDLRLDPALIEARPV
jgi:protocatechuate 3,4-dioxygenase beta subunit